MKTDTPRPILLKDYRPPNYLIDNVALDIALDAKRTRVSSRLALRPNPAHPAPGALRLNGETLELEAVLLDGRRLAAGDFELTETELILPAPPEGRFTLETITHC